jgi:soluble lytic murein transglycosylase-like protein
MNENTVVSVGLPVVSRQYSLGVLIQQDVNSKLISVSAKYLVDYEQMYFTIKGESGFNNSRIGAAGEIGLCQFMPSTWNWWNKVRGTNLNIHSVDDQLDMMAWAFSRGYQRHWSVWKNIYL